MRDSVPSGSYSSVCNVLRQWKSRSSLLIESTDSMIYTCIYDTMIMLLISLLINYIYIHALINANCAGTRLYSKPLTFDVGLIQLSFVPV